MNYELNSLLTKIENLNNNGLLGQGTCQEMKDLAKSIRARKAVSTKKANDFITIVLNTLNSDSLRDYTKQDFDLTKIYKLTKVRNTEFYKFNYFNNMDPTELTDCYIIAHNLKHGV